MCNKPSLPGINDTIAPKSSNLSTVPSYTFPISTSAVISAIRRCASAPCSELVHAIFTVPSSVISMLVPVSSVNARMTAPPLPITSRILSGLIFIVMMRGAKADISVFALLIAVFIIPKMCARPSFACAKATCIICEVIPVILISICSAVIPSSVPATLKSISPR